MIAFVKGEVAEVGDGYVIVENGGLGYRIFISGRENAGIRGVGVDVKLHTYFHVKEDVMQLYGFGEKDEMEIFKLLLSVNGIGPKAAMGILSVLSANELRFAVLSDDVKTISKAPGIGSKTAKKMILELKDKLSLEDAFQQRISDNQQEVAPGGRGGDNVGEAVQALAALGYSNSDALKAVRKVENSAKLSTEDILKQALKHMSFL